MTLTEFLLARIAEDERDARRLVETRDVGVLRMHSSDMSGPREDDEYAALNIGAGRVLADCAAKRRIVERLEPITEADDGCVCDRCMTLRDLADVYADHPDYREEWKP